MKECGESGKSKGNGIKEGCVRRQKMPMPLKNRKGKLALCLCHSLLASPVGGRHTILAALFSR